MLDEDSCRVYYKLSLANLCVESMKKQTPAPESKWDRPWELPVQCSHI